VQAARVAQIVQPARIIVRKCFSRLIPIDGPWGAWLRQRRELFAPVKSRR